MKPVNPRMPGHRFIAVPRGKAKALGAIGSAVLLSCTFAGCAPGGETTPADDASPTIDLEVTTGAFEAELKGIHDSGSFPGATAAFALPDGRVGAVAVGVSDREQQTPMTQDHRMLSGSIGKTFVAATALQLIQEGKLELDATVSSLLGHNDWYTQVPNGDIMTVRQLLNHSSGVPDHVYTDAYAQAVSSERSANPDLSFPPERQVSFVLGLDPLFPAGEGYQYTDTGYILLGLVIEQAGGEAYYDTMTRRFLEPLGLSLTSPSNTRDLPGLAAGYLDPEHPFGLPEKTATDGVMAFNPGSEWTGGGLATNPQDLVRWAKALYEGELLDDATQEMLFGINVARDQSDLRFYGAGVFTYDSELGDVVGHGGWFPGWRSQLIYLPEHEIAVAVQMNTDVDVNPYEAAERLAQVVIDQVAAPPPA